MPLKGPFLHAWYGPIGVPQPPYRASPTREWPPEGAAYRGPLKGTIIRAPFRGLQIGPIWTPKGTPIWALFVLMLIDDKTEYEDRQPQVHLQLFRVSRNTVVAGEPVAVSPSRIPSFLGLKVGPKKEGMREGGLHRYPSGGHVRIRKGPI